MGETTGEIVGRPAVRRRRASTDGLQRLGEASGFAAFLEELRTRRGTLRSGSDASASGPEPSWLPARTERCPECGFPVGADRHGWLKAGRRAYDPARAMTVDELQPCPSCSGDVRRRRNFARFRELMADARVPRIAEEWTFASFPGGPGKDEALGEVAAYARTELLGTFTNLYLYGPHGVGKTGLAVAVMRARLADLQPALFWTLPDLLGRIKATYDAGTEDSENALIEQIGGVGLLILDDLGTEKPSEWQREKLYQIVNQRMNEGRETVFTSNTPPLGLEAHIGARIVERIEYRCLPVEVGGANLRRQAGGDAR